MAILFVTAKPSYMPDCDELGEWKLVPNTKDLFVQKLGNHYIFAHECMNKAESQRLPEIKHDIVASWLDAALSWLESELGACSNDDIYLICHDKDLLDQSNKVNTDEGLFLKSKVRGHLQKKQIRDRHIYIFQHVVEQDMFKALIGSLFETTTENVEQAIQLINECTYETPCA